MFENIPNEVNLLFVTLLGLTFGSFVTLASYRLPRGGDIVFGQSECPSCKHKLGLFDLFPVLSWALRGGKCSHCKVKVSARYPLIEIVTAAMFTLTYIMMGISYQSGIVMLLCVGLMIMIVVDLEHKIIPDEIQLYLLLLGVAYRLLPETRDFYQLILGPIAGVSAGFAVRYLFTIWKGQEALGIGDVKFLATVGIFLQKDLIITFLFLAGVLGILTAMLWTAVGRGKQFPFGPALALSLYFCVVMPEMQGLVRDYISSVMVDY